MLHRLAILLMGVLLPLTAVADNLVFVHSYHFDYPWVKEYRSGFFNRIKNVDITEYQMDTKRRPMEDFPAIAEETWRFITKNNPDIVVVADDNALRYLGPRLVEADIPTVFLGINGNPRDYVPITPRLSGVLERPMMKRSIYMINKLIPDIKRLRIMMDNNPTSQANIRMAYGGRTKQTVSGVEVEVYLSTTFSEWKKELSSSAEQGFDAVIVDNYAALKDSKGQHVPLSEVISWSGEHTPVPLFAFWPYSVGPNKAVGGLSISALEQGMVAADLVNEFLQTGLMPTIATPRLGAFYFSKSELRRWELTLPEELEKKAVLMD